MIFFGYFFQFLAEVLSFIIQIFWWLVIVRAILSWVSPDPYNPIVRFIENTTEPLLAPFRKLIPAYRIGLDLSPIFALLLLYFLRIFVVQSLVLLAVRFR